MAPLGRQPTITAEQHLENVRLAKEETLSTFRGEDGKARKMPTGERDDLLAEKFPSILSLDWEKALANDTNLFARIMRDIIKLDQPRESGKHGPRPNVMDIDKGMASFRQLIGEDFSNLPFDETFAIMTRGNSVRQIARKAKLSPTEVQRLRLGRRRPTMFDMRAIAEGFNKHPSFFVEYRRNYIVEQLSDRLLDEPERITAYYQKMVSAQ